MTVPAKPVFNKRIFWDVNFENIDYNAKAKLPLMGEIESLNVSVAAGVILYEAVRQRG